MGQVLPVKGFDIVFYLFMLVFNVMYLLLNCQSFFFVEISFNQNYGKFSVFDSFCKQVGYATTKYKKYKFQIILIAH